MRAHEFITEGGKRLDQDTIDLVKMGWDDGKTPTEIAKDLGLTKSKVDGILTNYYSSRPIRMIKYGLALTDHDKDDMVSAFINGDSPIKIAKKYDLPPGSIINILKNKIGDLYDTEIENRKRTPGLRLSNKVTPDILDKVKELYISGKTLIDISNYLDNVIAPTTVRQVILRQPDYAELRDKRDERLRKINTGSVVTTNIHRPGTIDNQRSKGPGGRHTGGVDWPKYGE